MKPENKQIIDQLEKRKDSLPNDEYFDALKVSVLRQIQQEQSAKTLPFYRLKWVKFAAAAVFVGLLGTWFIQLQTEVTPSPEKVDFSQLSKKEILDYLHNNIEDVEVDELAALITDVPNLNDTVKTLPTNFNDVADNKLIEHHEELLKDINDEDILKYLEEEEFDIDEDYLLGS